MSIDAGDRWVEYQIEERQRVGRYMYDHQEDYISRSRYEKTVDQLNKAKVALRNVIDYLGQFCNDYPDCVIKAERFLEEVEK